MSMQTNERARHGVPDFWRWQLAGWGAFMVAMTFSRVGRFPLSYMVASKLVLATLGVVVSLGLRALYRRVRRGEPSTARIVVVAVVASYVAATVWTAAHTLLDHRIAYLFDLRPANIRSPLQLLYGAVYHAFALLAWSILYFAVTHHRALQAERERSLRAEALAQQARLQALRWQLNPHFLFNTLNAVSTLVAEERNAEAGRMLARLGDFLRLTLAGSDEPEVTVMDEIEYVRRYLDIERVRFGERLRVHFTHDRAAWGMRVPALLLQPLVENAVRYAIAPREEGGTLTIATRLDGATLRIVVQDDGPGLAGAAGAESGGGIGLANTRERLRQLYGDAARLALAEAPGGGLRVEIELPARPGTRVTPPRHPDRVPLRATAAETPGVG
jgi:two-component system, LytTR family, sensor kinase